MKKDIFNGKIKKEYVRTALFSAVFAALIYLACAILFLCLGLFYDNAEQSARAVLYVVCGVCFVLSVFYPLATVLCARSYPKHKKFAHVFLKPYLFVEEERSSDADAN
ncbi:MAG: hypothetical protein NC132_00125 [Corallococcus sp.]|nr:hypothetical protein [Corallococcus sp.]MCM1359130.1 hypothetical protein [Corallococcus sp.]MCM1394520.1 hypothetical protein [Corallococcus sp.]